MQFFSCQMKESQESPVEKTFVCLLSLLCIFNVSFPLQFFLYKSNDNFNKKKKPYIFLKQIKNKNMSRQATTRHGKSIDDN
jgi:hypothetical protein